MSAVSKQLEIEKFNNFCYSTCPNRYYLDDYNDWFFAVNGSVDDCDVLTTADPWNDINQMAPVIEKLIKDDNLMFSCLITSLSSSSFESEKDIVIIESFRDFITRALEKKGGG